MAQQRELDIVLLHLVDTALTPEIVKVIAWRLERLVQDGGFDTYWAGRLAAIGNLDYREAIRLRQAGASQEAIEILLS